MLNCQIEYFLPAIVVGLINFLIRSQRWGILIRAQKPVSTSTLFWACGTGYLGNNFLPFRAGEVIRSVTLGQKAGISKVYVFATAMTERVIDAIFLTLLALLLIPTLGSVPNWLLPVMRGVGILGFAALTVLFVAPRLRKVILSLLDHLPLPGSWRSTFVDMVEQFLLGATSFQNPGRAALFLLFTCLIWVMDGIGMMIAARAFSMEIHLSQSLLLLVGLGLSSAIPSVPGYVGIYQFVAVTVLALFGYPKGQALAFILVVQAMNMLMTLAWGLIGLWKLGIQPNELRKEKN